ncbi:hypothetical protein XENTR_v10000274 [Xenopus tropicalis]|nr:hypothetical protein XENTR_v10000274 [Xenopus tropicalis]
MIFFFLSQLFREKVSVLSFPVIFPNCSKTLIWNCNKPVPQLIECIFQTRLLFGKRVLYLICSTSIIYTPPPPKKTFPAPPPFYISHLSPQ